MSQMEMVITIPKELTYTSLQLFICQIDFENILNGKVSAEKIIFDFRKCQVISATGIVFIKMMRDYLQNKGISLFYRKSHDTTAQKFMDRMKLFSSKDEYEDTCEISDIYEYPLHLCNSVEESEKAHSEIIESLKTSFQTMEDSTCTAIDYILTEIRDNAGVHGYEAYTSTNYRLPVYICCNENNNCIEVCIGDLGQGIYNSLTRNNQNVKGLSRKKTVLEALKNNVSGHPDDSPGFGLYSSNELITRGQGELHMWSSNCYVKSLDGVEKIYKTNYPYGTIVTFVIDKSALISFNEFFESHKLRKNTQTHIEDFMEGIFDG